MPSWHGAQVTRFLRGNGANAVASLQEMLAQQLQANVLHFNASIAAVGQAQDWQAALSCLRMMEVHQVKKDTITYNTCMTTCTKVTELQKSLALYGDMSRLEVYKDRFTYSATIKVCEKMTQWPLVLCLMQDMQERNVTRDEVIYNATITSLREKWVSWRPICARAGWLKVDGLAQEACKTKNHMCHMSLYCHCILSCEDLWFMIRQLYVLLLVYTEYWFIILPLFVVKPFGCPGKKMEMHFNGTMCIYTYIYIHTCFLNPTMTHQWTSWYPPEKSSSKKGACLTLLLQYGDEETAKGFSEL